MASFRIKNVHSVSEDLRNENISFFLFAEMVQKGDTHLTELEQAESFLLHSLSTI